MGNDLLEPKFVEYIIKFVGVACVWRIVEETSLWVGVSPAVYVSAGTCGHGDKPRLWIGYAAAIGQQELDERLLNRIFDVVVSG